MFLKHILIVMEIKMKKVKKIYKNRFLNKQTLYQVINMWEQLGYKVILI